MRKAAAFGVPDERLGEKVCLAIIGRDGVPGADELLQHLASEGLSKFDMPEYFAVVDAFPLTASGKVLKRELMQWVASGLLQPQSVRYKAPESPPHPTPAAGAARGSGSTTKAAP